MELTIAPGFRDEALFYAVGLNRLERTIHRHTSTPRQRWAWAKALKLHVSEAEGMYFWDETSRLRVLYYLAKAMGDTCHLSNGETLNQTLRSALLELRERRREAFRHLIGVLEDPKSGPEAAKAMGISRSRVIRVLAQAKSDFEWALKRQGLELETIYAEILTFIEALPTT